MLPRPRIPPLRPALVGTGVRLALMVLFLWLVARQWHPYYGFTRFLQADGDVAAKMPPSLQGAPIYTDVFPGSYDGFFYAEIATDPSLRSPKLRAAVDDLGYRGRRILLSATAWLAGAGDAVAAVRAYAWLNVLLWLVGAGLFWRLFPVTEWRGTFAWAGLLYATGTLLSVRLALTDLAALVLTAAALMELERGRRFRGAGWLATAALARETAVLAVVGLLPRSGEARRQRRRALLPLLLVLLPLGAWLGYVWMTVGSSSAGLDNFHWPFAALAQKLRSTCAAWRAAPGDVLAVTSLASFAALITQAVYLLAHPARDNPWWRTGAAYAVLMACLGPAVWGDDLPGAAVRVLLPLGLAFNVLAVRARASVAWLVLGNLSVFGGVPALWPVQRDPHELAVGRSGGASFVVHTDSRWYAVETRRERRWAWNAGAGTLRIEGWPRESRPQRVRITVVGISPRVLAIASGGHSLWQGPIGDSSSVVEVPIPPEIAANPLELMLTTPASAQPVGEPPHARRLSFSVSGVAID